jgi:hypothetical protein
MLEHIILDKEPMERAVGYIYFLGGALENRR